MDGILFPLIVSYGAVALLMTAAWAWGKSISNYSIVDAFWAFNFILIAGIAYALSEGDPTRRLLACGLTALWGLRLGIHLGTRIFSHLDEEEGRYKQLRSEWAENIGLKFFAFYQAQALSNLLLCLPLFIMGANKDPQISPLEWTGFSLCLISIIGEAVSDAQLKAFKADPANKGKVCDYGLWNYSRHPNYFFQIMIWTSVLIASLGSPYGWIAVICPLSIGYLIFRVTGIPMAEEQSLRSRGDAYRRYQEKTSVLVPWFHKK